MRKINYPLIISDFDGTLADGKNGVPESVRNAINNYVCAGGIFVVITGRMISSILPRVRALGLKGLVAGYQGTVIADIESGKLIKKGVLTVESASEICALISKNGGKSNIYCDEVLYTERELNDPLIKLYCDVTGVVAKSINENGADFIRKNNLLCQKITALTATLDERDRLYNALKTQFKDEYDITYSANVLVEASPKGDNKGEALKFVANHYGIPIERTVAVGDNLNDLPMIEAAGVGIAVANADENLKKRAKVVTVSNDEGAIAKVISEYGFERA